MGSVKDIEVLTHPSEEELGRGFFIFSDRYSVFDWGEMPDHIKDKGKVLAMMAAFNFELLESNEIETHYIGMENRLNLAELKAPTNKMRISLAHIPRTHYSGTYRYESLRSRNNFFIPLEVIYRNSIPVGSSLRLRFSPQQLGFEFDRDRWPNHTLALKSPILELSTKLEEKDRYLTEEEARKISGLSDSEFEKLKSLALKINSIISKHASLRGFKHLDGKLEFIYSKGRIILADVAGTFDESRFSFDGVQISKELLRQWYLRNNREWCDSVKNAKAEAEKKGIRDWKSLVKIQPKKLDPLFLSLIENLYKAGANRWCGKNYFEAPPLKKVIQRLKKNKGLNRK